LAERPILTVKFQLAGKGLPDGLPPVRRPTPTSFIEFSAMSDFQKLSDESLLRYYESIREQVAGETRSGTPHRFMGEAMKQRSEQLRDELDRRRLRFRDIDWPRSSPDRFKRFWSFVRRTVVR